MPRTKIKPNAQLKQIVLEETNDGRDVVRYLKSTFMVVEDAPRLFGLRHKDYARTHKIAAARILARIGLEEGKRYLRRTYVRTPFKRVHPEDEDLPKKDMAASTSELYRLVRKETNDGRDIITRFVGIMKGYYPEYKPHLRMAAAKELIRQIEFDYDDEPTSPTSTRTESTPASEHVGASLVGTPDPQPATSDESAAASPANPIHPDSDNSAEDLPDHANPIYPINPANPDSDKEPDTDQPNPIHPINPVNPDSDNTINPIPNSELPIENSESPVSLAQIQRRMHIEDGSVHYRDYAERHAQQSESIYQSIIRRASESYGLEDAKREAEELIGQFDRFMAERDPGYQPIAVPDPLLTRSLTQRMDESQPSVFDPADYYDLDQDYFYYCLCGYCEQCDELNYFFEFMRELEEEYEDP